MKAEAEVCEFDGTRSSSQDVVWATYLGMAGNIFLAIVKLVVGVLSASSALVADGFHSLSDVISSVVILLGLRISEIPADREHPYGHGKAEVLAASLVSIILLGIGSYTLYKAILAIGMERVREVPGELALVAAIVSVIVKEGLFRYKISVGKRSGSRSIVADAWHHRSDALSSVVAFIAVLISIAAGVKYSFVDDLGAVIIGVMIVWIGVSLFFYSSKELMDSVVRGAPVDRIREFGATLDGVGRIEKVYVRKAGLDLLVDLHVQVDGNLTVRDGHRIGHELKSLIMDGMPAVKSVLVHVEPLETDSL
mgnify:CR=1 FL=1